VYEGHDFFSAHRRERGNCLASRPYTSPVHLQRAEPAAARVRSDGQDENRFTLYCRDTTVWRTWIGFNASHSFSLIFFGAVYGYLATLHRAFLFHSWFLLVLGFGLLLGYVVVAKLYFFRAPFLGVLLAAVLYLLGVVINLV
jgi:hypothetical protein